MSGVSIARREIELEDPYENMGTRQLKKLQQRLTML